MFQTVWMIVFLSSGMRGSGGIRFTGGGYEDLVVQFDPNLGEAPPSPCWSFFNTFEESFRECSRQLFDSTERRAFIRHIDVIVPSAWNMISCQRPSSKWPLFQEADVRIGPPHPLFGVNPWTQRSSGNSSSVPGDWISLSASYFLDPTVNNVVRGHQLLVQFTRWRYGIHHDPNCDSCSRTHDAHLTTRLHQVVATHPDFRSSNTPATWTPVLFTYRTPSWPKWIVAVDHRIGSVDRDAWNFTRVALRMMLDYMEPDMEMALLSMSDRSADVSHQLSPLKPARMLDQLIALPPIVVHDSNLTCLNCAFSQAIHLLESARSPVAGNALVFIISGPISPLDLNSVLQQAILAQMRISFVHFGTSSELKTLTEAAKQTNGMAAQIVTRWTSLDSQKQHFLNLSVLLDLEDALVSVLKFHGDVRPISVPVTIHQQVFTMGPKPTFGDKENRNGSFILDETVRSAILRVYFSQTENPYSILGFTVSNATHTLPGKRFFPRDTKPWVYFWPQDEPDTSFTRPGNWTYKFSRRYPTIQPNFVRVIAKVDRPPERPKPVAKLHLAGQNSTRSLLVTVELNRLPVFEANVQATTNQSQSRIVLFDDGKDPDAIKNDGVYSARVTLDLPTEVTVDVDDNQGRSYSIQWTSHIDKWTDRFEIPAKDRITNDPFHIRIQQTFSAPVETNSALFTNPIEITNVTGQVINTQTTTHLPELRDSHKNSTEINLTSSTTGATVTSSIRTNHSASLSTDLLVNSTTSIDLGRIKSETTTTTSIETSSFAPNQSRDLSTRPEFTSTTTEPSISPITTDLSENSTVNDVISTDEVESTSISPTTSDLSLYSTSFSTSSLNLHNNESTSSSGTAKSIKLFVIYICFQFVTFA